MKLKVLFGICVFILMSFTTFSQEYINSGKLIEKLEQEVNDPSFDMKKVNMFYNTFHIDREDHKIDLHPSTAEKRYCTRKKSTKRGFRIFIYFYRFMSPINLTS